MLSFPSGSGDTDILYVASVQGMNHGAGVLAYPGFLDVAAQKFGGDFFIIPSSVHEVLLMKDEGGITAKEMQDIISSVNQNEVAPEERLSDHAYRYDSKEHVFELAEKHEERMKARREHLNVDGRDSVLFSCRKEKTV